MLRNNRVLWTIQILLAALYLFAGGLQLVGPAEVMQPPGGQRQPLDRLAQRGRDIVAAWRARNRPVLLIRRRSQWSATCSQFCCFVLPVRRPHKLRTPSCWRG